MMDDKQKTVQRRTRWRLVLITIACLGIAGLSLWVRAGHAVTLPVSVGFVALLLVIFVVPRTDPAFSAKFGQSGSSQRQWLSRGTLSAMALAAILLMLGDLKLMQAVPAIPLALRPILGPLSINELLIGNFVFCFALVWAAVALYDRYIKSQR